MRARLLDMGLVSPLRALSLRLAVAEALGADGEPAAVLACASSPAVITGRERGNAAGVEPRAGAVAGLPVLRLPGDAPRTVVSEGALSLSLLLPWRRLAELAIPEAGSEIGVWWARLLAEVGGDTERETPASVDEIGGCTVLAGWLEPAGGEGDPSPRSPADAAEAWLQALEREAGLEPVPSMPTPVELEAVYEWDRRLARMAEGEALPAVAGPVH